MMQEKKNNHYRFVLIGLTLLLSVIIFKEMQAYLGGFLAAVVMYTILRGLMGRLVENRKWSRGLSAAVIVTGTIIFILIPFTGIGFLVADTISGIKIDPAQIMTSITDFANTIEERFGIVITPEDLSFIPQAGTSVMQTVATGLSTMVINSIVAVFVLFFMLISYDSLKRISLEMLPFTEENKQILLGETKSIILSNAIGIPVVAMTQGLLAYVGYLSMGVNNPLVYAVLVAFTTIIPVVGTSLVWVPIGISALMEGDMLRGILLLTYGLLIIGGSDAVIRFVLQKKLANIHPLITFFGVFIGLAMFGFWGVIFGPLLLSLMVLLFNMYRHDYIIGSTAQPWVTTRENTQRNVLFGKRTKRP